MSQPAPQYGPPPVQPQPTRRTLPVTRTSLIVGAVAALALFGLGITVGAGGEPEVRTVTKEVVKEVEVPGPTVTETAAAPAQTVGASQACQAWIAEYLLITSELANQHAGLLGAIGTMADTGDVSVLMPYVDVAVAEDMGARSKDLNSRIEVCTG